MAIIYVDDTDILHINLTKDESVKEVLQAMQSSINSWGNLLIATGGALQPKKCIYSIIWYEGEDGQRRHADNFVRGDFGMTVPLSGGIVATILDHKKVNHVEKTLGAMTSPDGNSSAKLQMMQEKAQQWINVIKNGHLHHPNVWFSLKVQFWPRIQYGLCSSTATFHKLENTLQQQYYQLLPLCKVGRSTSLES